jgi:hypothetical protein
VTTLTRFLRQNVIALLALFVALSGTAYAAGLPRGSVGTPQLKSNAVTTQKLARGSVTGSDVRGRAIGRGHLAPSAVAFADGGVRDAENPPAAPFGSAYDERTVRLPRTGTVIVDVSNPNAGLSCGSGTAVAGIYWDGRPVPGGAVDVQAVTSPRPIRIVARVSSRAGAHTAELRIGCPSGGTGGQSISVYTAWSFTMP